MTGFVDIIIFAIVVTAESQCRVVYIENIIYDCKNVRVISTLPELSQLHLFRCFYNASIISKLLVSGKIVLTDMKTLHFMGYYRNHQTAVTELT